MLTLNMDVNHRRMVELELSMNDLAKAARISPLTVRNLFERGAVRSPTAIKLCKALGVRGDELIKEVPRETESAESKNVGNLHGHSQVVYVHD